MANTNDGRTEDYNEETQFDELETPVEQEQPQETRYEDYAEQNEPDNNQGSLEDIPDKYQGKDVKDIVAMHQNAEKLLGKQSQEVGELRKVVDDFIRAQTVTQQQQQAPAPVEEDFDDLDFFENPKEAISKMLENHPSVKQSREATARLAQQETVAKLKSQHPDFQNIVADKGFIEWVGKSKVRTQLLRNADAFDYDSADELFSLWKERQSMVKQATTQETTARKQAVKSASTGNARGSGERPSRKVYRRADIVELMAKDPQRYQALAGEIRQAYAEGRVK
jgi:hypothetical protein